MYSKGSTATINVTAQDYDKKPVATAIPRRAEPLELAEAFWANWFPHAQGQTGADGKGQVQFTIPDRGRIPGSRHRESRRRSARWKTQPTCGPRAKARCGPARSRNASRLSPTKSRMLPGDTAHVLIVTGKEPASVLVTAEGNGLYSEQVIKSSGGSITVDVPVRRNLRPTSMCRRSSFATTSFTPGNKSLKVPPTQHEFKVDLQPSKPQYQPGQARRVTPSRRPTRAASRLPADFSLGVVDEAIYAIQPETVGNIVNAFYGTVYSKVSTDSFAHLLLQRTGGQARHAVGETCGRRTRRSPNSSPNGWCSPRFARLFPIPPIGWPMCAPTATARRR